MAVCQNEFSPIATRRGVLKIQLELLEFSKEMILNSSHSNNLLDCNSKK